MRASSILVSLLVSVCCACTPQDTADEPVPEAGFGADGKADDYYSPTGREYDVDTEVDLGAASTRSAAERRARDRIDVITQKLEARLWEIWPQEVRRDDNGLVIMLRSRTAGLEDLSRGDDGRWRFTYVAQVAGPHDLLSKFPLEIVDGQHYLRVEASGIEYLVRFRVATMSDNAYPDYAALLANGGGVIEASIHFSGHIPWKEDRWDLRQARDLFRQLVARGFRPPVATFDELLQAGPEIYDREGGGPFVKFVTIDDHLARQIGGLAELRGGVVQINVRIYLADFATADERLAAYRDAARYDDLVIYDGHASQRETYSGINLVFREGMKPIGITMAEFEDLPVADKYQIFFFHGCNTYHGYADALYANPAKDAGNLDIMTTVNKVILGSDGSLAFLDALTFNDGSERLATADGDVIDGRWYPLSWDELLRRVDAAKAGDDRNVIYGVHGIDDDPHSSPLAVAEMIGEPCETRADCPGADSLCVRYRRPGTSTPIRACGAACTADDGCPAGSSCVPVTNAPVLDDTRQCLSR